MMEMNGKQRRINNRMSNKWGLTDDETFVNEKLVEKVLDLKEFDETVSKKFFEDINISEIGRKFENATEQDILTVCYIAVRRFPLKYVTVLMDYLLEKEEK